MVSEVDRARRVKVNTVWTGKLALAPDKTLTEPLRRRKSTMYFVNSMGDLFHEDCPDEWIDRIFAVMALAPQHTFQVLTKRSARMRAYFALDDTGRADFMYRIDGRCDELVAHSGLLRGAKYDKGESYEPPHWPLPNVWIGVSVEDQTRADERIPDLLATPAVVRFVSYEPALGAVDFRSWLGGQNGDSDSARRSALSWVICGGESGPGARPMHPQWARDVRDRCTAAGVPFFFKQWGEWLPGQNDPHPLQQHGIAHWQDGIWGPRNTPHPELNYVMWDDDGCLHPGESRSIDNYFDVAVWSSRVGKKRAGRLLDGVEHNGMPEARG